jgi:predicted RNA-binding Zn ribbon-like protein
MDTIAPTATHAHAVGLDACADLINTLVRTDDRLDDQLVTPEDALAFLVERHLGHEEDLRRQALRDGDPWLARVRDARAALHELWDARVEGRAPARAALATLNRLLDRGPRVELHATLAGVEVAHRHREDDPTGEALARVAQPLVDAIAAGETDRFRICANEGCRWVFEDASRAGRRRWCDMATCGNRAKVRRYRSRHRDDPDLGPGGESDAAADLAAVGASNAPADAVVNPAREHEHLAHG